LEPSTIPRYDICESLSFYEPFLSSASLKAPKPPDFTDETNYPTATPTTFTATTTSELPDARCVTLDTINVFGP